MITAYYFSSPSCGPCRVVKPEWEKLVDFYKNEQNVSMQYIDVSVSTENYNLAREYNIFRVPTFIVKNNDEVLFNESGTNAIKGIETTLNSLLY